MRTIRVASRRSDLALTQTNWVIEQLRLGFPQLQFEIVPVVTKGDRILDVTLSKVGGKGLFVSEVEELLLSKAADFAVHSLKDVPAQLADGLVLSAIPPREDPRDAIISPTTRGFGSLPPGATVGTSSLRRVAQLKASREDLSFASIRGNIDTRLKKLHTEGFDAIVLAAAGLHRMGWAHQITEYIPVETCLPAVGQGILGIESRVGDEDINTILQTLNDPNTETVARAERTLLNALNGGCQVPIAGHAVVTEEGMVWLRGFVGTSDGKQVLRAEATGQHPEEVGLAVAEQLRSHGAAEILATSGDDVRR